METKQTSLFYKAYNPFLQAGIVFVSGLVVSLGAKVLQFINLVEIGNYFPWMTAAAFLLFFALFNSIFSLSAEDLNKYWTKSILSFALLAVLSGLAAWAISAISIYDAGSYAWIFTALTFVYLVFLSIMGFMKNIVEFAEKEEWNSPRFRQRKRR